jgi:hypothetical protein
LHSAVARGRGLASALYVRLRRGFVVMPGVLGSARLAGRGFAAAQSVRPLASSCTLLARCQSGELLGASNA